MLKFVSTKPPKGKSDVHPDFHRQARGHFRVKAADQGSGLRTFDGENSRDYDGREPQIVQHEIPGLDYDNLSGDGQQRGGVHTYGQNLHAQPEMFNTRSRTPSASSQESSRSLLRSYQSDLFGRRSGPYRHVTWSPEVTNGDQSQIGHPLADVQFRKQNGTNKEKKQRSFAKSSKKSLQGISRFLLGDSKKNKLDSGDEIEMDNLHRNSVENSHAVISDYLKSVEKPGGSGHTTQTSTNEINNVSVSTNQKKGSIYKSTESDSKIKRSTPWSLHKVFHHFQNKKDQGQGHTKEQRDLNIKNEKREVDAGGEDYYDNSGTSGSVRSHFTTLRTGKTDVVHSPPKSSQSSQFVFSPIYSSTPKKKEMDKPRDMKMLIADDEKGRYEGNAIPVASTWEQRPFTSDYEEIRTTDRSSLPQVADSLSAKSDIAQSKTAINETVLRDSDVTKHSHPHHKKRKRNYPRLNLNPYRDASKFDIARPVPNSTYSTQHSQKDGVYSKIKHSPPPSTSRDLSIKTGQSDKGKIEISKVMTSCVPQINHDMNKNETVRRYQVTREIPISGSQSQHSVMTTPLHEMIHRSHDHKMAEDQVEMDLVYITERLISMSFPSDEQEAGYQYNLKGVMNMLRGKHGENVLILNFSEPRNDLQKENNQRVIDYGWPDHLAPPLERLCNICKSIDSWLNSDPSHVIVLHSKGGRGRLAVVIAAFMHYSSICASADQAMDRMAMKRFFDDKLSGYLYPSHKRYVQYFSGLLSGAIKINSHALYLHHLVIHGVPNFDTHGGCRPFIKVYQGMQPIFTSGVYNVTDQMQKVCISISPGIPLRGDIMIKCYHKRVKTGQREPIWRCQFHTCAISHYSLLFGKNELDDAINDPRFPGSGKVEFVFGANQDANVQVSDFKSDVTVPVDDNTDGLVRWDSYENFSHIDGVPSQDGVLGNTTTSPNSMSPPYGSYNTETRQYATSQHSSNYSTSSSLPKQTVPPLDERTQLDNILSDLLNDQAYVSPKSGSNTLSKETRTFRTYETQKGPDGRLAHQTAEVTYKLPGEVKEERSYTMKTEKDMKSSYAPTSAFSYTPTSPELARRVESPRTNTLPYRTDYDNRFHSESYSYNTLDNSRSDSDSSWLQQQQRKLRERKDSKDEKRVQQEKQLVEELRTAQNRYMTKRAQSEEEERNIMDTYKMNGPTSASPSGYSYSMSRTQTSYSSDKSPSNLSSGTLEHTRTQKSEKVENDSNRLDELERSLQAASNSIIATQQPSSWQQQKTTNQGYKQEHVVTRRVETRKYETHHQQQQQQQQQVQQPQPPPRQIRTVEEDRFSLRPIGPGVTPLEPEGGVGTGTLNRATTPSFPVSPVASAAGSSRVVEIQRSPSQPQQPQQFSQQQQQQQEYRYEYQTQYNTSGQQQNQGQINQPVPLDSPPSGFGQQHGQISQPVPLAAPPSGFGQQQEYTTQQRQYTQRSYQQDGGGTLHVDTSPKMLSPGTASSTMTRSPSSPHSPDTLNSLRQQLNVAHNMSTGAVSPVSHSMTGQSSPSVYFGLSRRGSISSLAESVDATHTTPRFVKDTSKYWYKPHISREEAIAVLKDKPPGTFIVRDSNSFPGAFGLALKVATLPPNVQTKSTGDPAADLVRHFLIEPTPKGVRLRGCSNEPVFGSLASLVYQHSITPLALPCKLALPDIDPSVETSTMDSSVTSELPSSAAALLAQGAACNVLYLHSIDTESLTGPQAVSKAIKLTLDQAQNIKQTVVHFKVSNQGITLTDNQRKLFFRRHYAVSAVTYCGMDPEGRKWLRPSDVPGVNVEARIFGFVARKQGGVSDNACHLFAELDPEQPASAIVNFVTKIMIGQGKVKP